MTKPQYIVQIGHGGRGWEDQSFIIFGPPTKRDIAKIATLIKGLDVDGRVVIRRGDDTP